MARKPDGPPGITQFAILSTRDHEFLETWAVELLVSGNQQGFDRFCDAIRLLVGGLARDNIRYHAEELARQQKQ